MVAWWRKNGTWPIGCAVADRQIRLAQLRLGRRGEPALKFAMHTIAADSDDTERWPSAASAALRQAAAGLTGRHVVTCVPPDQVTYRHLRLAPMPEAELPEAVHWRAAKEMDRPGEELCCDYYDVGEILDAGKGRLEVIAVAASMKDINQHTDMIQSAGLTSTAIDAAPGALARCLVGAIRNEEAGDAKFVIDMGASGCTLSVVCGGLPRFVRSFPTGRRQMVQRAAERAGLDARSHKLLWSQLDGEDPAHSANSELIEKVRRSLSQLCNSVAAELAHEATMCVHYLNQARLSMCEPMVGCVVGAGFQEQQLIDALNETSKIEFHPLTDLISPTLRPLMGQLPADDRLDNWLLPIGLALYGQEPVAQGAAA